MAAKKRAKRTETRTLGQRLRGVALFEQLGPGLITGAADDDPSGIATYSQGGAQFGFGLLWTLVLTFPLMVSIQLVSAHIGRVTDKGLAQNMAQVMPGPVVLTLVALLFVANTINIGADVAAMGEAARLVTGGGEHVFTIVFALVSIVLQMFVPYKRYARFLTVLTLSLFSYVALVFMIHLNWSEVGLGMIGVHADLSKAAAVTIVAIFGTTISPYLFFWQSSQEVEEVDHHAGQHALTQSPEQAPGAFRRMRIDTIAGMAVSNLVALAIMISTAATLHAAGKTDIQSAAQAAEALKPIAGNFAFALFSLGIIGTGMLAIPVLAGSAAYAIGETRGWKVGLDNKPWEAVGFYLVIAMAVVLGIGIDYSPIDPIKALYWSAVLNGVIAVPIMAAMMYVAGNKKKMGQFTAGRALSILGWTSTAVMAAAAIAMFVTSF
jgi:Mn2+/Fe2+ NRAMP family transporter